MALAKYKLGALIKQRREKYDGSEELPIRGVAREGFITPKQDGADLSIYNVYYLNDFVFNPARMELNSIALNTFWDKAICSSLYEIFYVMRTDLLLPEYLNLFIKRDEFARKCWFEAVGSARNYFRVADLSEFDIELPDIITQQKYVDIYKAMVANQQGYERGLEDLKLSIPKSNLYEIRMRIRTGGWRAKADEKEQVNYLINFMNLMLANTVDKNNKWEYIVASLRTQPILQAIRKVYSTLEPWKHFSSDPWKQHYYQLNVDLLFEQIINACNVACINDCGNGVSEMKLTLEAVKLLKSKGDAVSAQIKIVWKDASQKYSEGSRGYLSMIGGLSNDPKRARELADSITKTAASDPSIKAIKSLVSDVKEAQQIAYTFSLNPEIEAFLKKVSSQQATVVDLTPNILNWLKEKKLISKLWSVGQEQRVGKAGGFGALG